MRGGEAVTDKGVIKENNRKKAIQYLEGLSQNLVWLSEKKLDSLEKNLADLQQNQDQLNKSVDGPVNLKCSVISSDAISIRNTGR